MSRPPHYDELDDLASAHFDDWSRGFNLSNEQTSEPTLPFNLTHLNAYLVSDSPPNYFSRIPFIDHMLVALSRQSSITSLAISSYGEEGAHLDVLAPLAPQLDEFECMLHDRNESGWTAAALESFFKRCTRLKHLTCNAPNIPSVVHLASTLDSWNPTGCKEVDIDPILNVLKSKTAATSKLRNLYIPRSGMLAALWVSWKTRSRSGVDGRSLWKCVGRGRSSCPWYDKFFKEQRSESVFLCPLR